MSNIFVQLLNMSISASWLILAIIVFRMLFFGSPKWIRVVLWSLVAVRLVVPFTFESVFSLIPEHSPVLSGTKLYMDTNSGQLAYTTPVMSVTYDGQVDMINITNIIGIVWVVGAAAMLIYMLISYFSVRRKASEGIEISKNIRICDRIDSPFILGVFRPRIYLNSSTKDSDRNYVIAHEKAHLSRLDNIWKPIGFILLSIYWFNPVCWVAYLLFNRDIELACDEKVVREYDTDDKKAYANALLMCSSRHHRISACPLAFAECSIKHRVKSILKYKKPKIFVVCASAAVCVVLSACFMTDPVSVEEKVIDKMVNAEFPTLSVDVTEVPTEPTTEAVKEIVKKTSEKSAEKPSDKSETQPTEAVNDEPLYSEGYNDSFDSSDISDYGYDNNNSSDGGYVEIQPFTSNPEDYVSPYNYGGINDSFHGSISSSENTAAGDDGSVSVIKWDIAADNAFE